jgi:cytochrome c
MKWKLVPAALALGLTVALGAGVAQADGHAAKGKKVFNKCKACHSLKPGKKKVGPSLAGIFGREAGTSEGFKYSKAMKSSGITWDEDNLDAFLTKPKDLVPGTKMSFRGIKKEKDRENLIEFLKQQSM